MNRNLATLLMASALFIASSAAAQSDDGASGSSEPFKQVSAALGYVYMPDLPIGVSLSFYNMLWDVVGFDGAINFGGAVPNTSRTEGSLGINYEIPFLEGLYLAVAPTIGRQTEVRTMKGERCRVYHGEDHCDTVDVKETKIGGLTVGAEAKVTYHLFSLIGLSVGYRIPFDAIDNGSFLFGASLLISS